MILYSRPGRHSVVSTLVSSPWRWSHHDGHETWFGEAQPQRERWWHDGGEPTRRGRHWGGGHTTMLLMVMTSWVHHLCRVERLPAQTGLLWKIHASQGEARPMNDWFFLPHLTPGCTISSAWNTPSPPNCFAYKVQNIRNAKSANCRFCIRTFCIFLPHEALLSYRNGYIRPRPWSYTLVDPAPPPLTWRIWLMASNVYNWHSLLSLWRI